MTIDGNILYECLIAIAVGGVIGVVGSILVDWQRAYLEQQDARRAKAAQAREDAKR
jgi:NhaP-type Na+/H+ or K+/H+ antiporter